MTDSYALKLANRLFRVFQWFLSRTFGWSPRNKVEVARRPQPNPERLHLHQDLYFLEPLRDPVSGELNGGEFEAIRSWLSNISELQQAGLLFKE